MKDQEPWRRGAQSFGNYLRAQRKLAEMSLRDLASESKVSNAYLSQLERGLHQPSVRVVRSIAAALDIPQNQLLERLGLLSTDDREPPSGRLDDRGIAVESAIRSDTRLTDSQRDALISVYQSYLQVRAPDG